MVNEIALALLLGLFGWKVTVLYKVLGSGCRNCEVTAKTIAEAAAATGVETALEKVTDLASIMSYGVMSTPGW